MISESINHHLIKPCQARGPLPRRRRRQIEKLAPRILIDRPPYLRPLA
jgi:hypothetical protein